MVLYLSRRKKIVISGAAISFAIGLTFSINETLHNYNWNPVLISYSQAAPSTIAKNRPNETGFNSPVTNAKFDPLKQPEPKKVEKTTPEVNVPKIEEKPLVSKPEIKPEITKKPSATLEAPTPIPASPSKRAHSPSYTRSETITRTETPAKPAASPSSGQIEGAKANWKIGIASSIRRTESNIRQHQERINELTRRMKEEYNLYSYGGKVSKENFEEAMKHQIWVENNYKEREEAYLKVLKEDQARDPRFTEADLKSIARGMTVSKDDHNVWTFVDPNDNPVTGKNGTYRKRNERRVLNTPGWTPRNPHGIANQDFEGWDKKDVTSNSEFKTEIDKILGNGSGKDSIKVYEYTPNDQNPNKSSKSKIVAVSLDANDENAFNKFQEFLKSTAGAKIDAVVLKNVGSTKQGQNIAKILEALPNNVQKLTLFLDDQKAINGLAAIRGKKLKELELYSNTKAIDENWSINPNAIADVDYISFDYNNAATYHKNNPSEKIPGSILFDTLRWDKNDDESKITEGLRVAFGSKMYQRAFQGRQGGKGGYPTNLDFSDTNIKTIKNLKFDEIDKLFNEKVENWEDDKYAKEDYLGFKKLRFTNLYFGADQNSTSGSSGSEKTFSASVSDFDGANYTERLSGIQEPFIPPAAGIYFRINGENQQNVVFNLSGNLTEDGKKQLKAFVEAVNRGYPFAKIVVDSEDIKNELIKYYQENTKDPERKKRSEGKFAERDLEVKSSSSTAK